MSIFATRLVRVFTFSAVGSSLLSGAAGCTAMCQLDTRHGAARSNQPYDYTAATEAPARSVDSDVREGPRDGQDDMSATVPVWPSEPEPAAIMPVNIFGEVGGVERRPSSGVGESGFQQHTLADEGEDSDVTVDPTGRWLVFTSTRHNESGDIYLQRVDGTSVTQLTNDAARDAYPAISPDGKWIAFSSTRAGNWQVFRMDLDGRNVVQVTSGPMQAIHPSFSPDGTRLVYSAMGARSQQWELWTVSMLTGERRQIGYGLFPSWSPDKSVDRVAYQRARQRGSRWFSLWTLDLVNGEGRRMTEVAVSANAAIVAPCWSPDGTKLAFTTVVQGADRAADGKSGRAGQQDVWTVNADGSNKRRLTDGNGTNLTPAWATDHRVYFVSDRGGNESVWSVNADAIDAFTVEAANANKPAAPNIPVNDRPQPAMLESADTQDGGH